MLTQSVVRVLMASLSILALSEIAFSRSFSVKAPQPWVRTVNSSFETPNQSDAISSTRLLEDVQVKLGERTVDRYYHYVTSINNASGLEDLSQLRFYFEPSYQQLTIHFVRIRREGQTIDVLRPSEIKMIQQEEDLDQQQYNGTQAALIFVNDLRVGDIVDYAFTVKGENPILGGRFAETFYLAESYPIREVVLRLLSPSRRPLAIKNDNTTLAPSQQVIGEDTEYLWYQKDVAPISGDDYTPSWFSAYPRITVSEFQRWSDVVDWALPFYRLPLVTDADLKLKIEKWKSDAANPEDQAVLALRFVQDEIRYLGIELGRYSHQPTLPEKVFKRRFGDCKDKSLLLSTIYNAMGFEAAPALVNTRARADVESWQASPFAFDHVIVRAHINGKTYWFDPTISYERGSLDYYNPPLYARSLVLRPGTKELESIPVPKSSAGSIEAVESYSRQNPQLPILLTVTTTYRGLNANEMRYEIATSSLSGLGRSYLNYYAEYTPQISADGPPVVEDDEKTNTIVLKEKYSIAELWKESRHRFLAEKISPELSKPRVSQRTMPLRVAYPLWIRQTILIDLGPGYYLPPGTDVFLDDAMRFEYRYSKNGDQLRMDYSLQTFAEAVPVEKVQQHLALLDKAQEFVGFELTDRSVAVAYTTNTGSVRAAAWIVLLLGVCGVGGFLFWLVRSQLRRPSKGFVEALNPRVGTAPESAIRVTSEQQLHEALLQHRCRCGHHSYDPNSPPPRERLTYDAKRLIVIHLMCPICKYNDELYAYFEAEERMESQRLGEQLGL